MRQRKLPARAAYAQAQLIWEDMIYEVAREIHGDERDFKEKPLNDGERMTCRNRIPTDEFFKRLNRAQRRALGARGAQLPVTMATKIKQRRAA